MTERGCTLIAQFATTGLRIERKGAIGRRALIMYAVAPNENPNTLDPSDTAEAGKAYCVSDTALNQRTAV
jgi:hypothetical protein